MASEHAAEYFKKHFFDALRRNIDDGVSNNNNQNIEIDANKSLNRNFVKKK